MWEELAGLVENIMRRHIALRNTCRNPPLPIYRYTPYIRIIVKN